jgi:hypothetical protein
MENGLPGRTRWLDVAPGRLPGWLESFADRHGGLTGAPRYLRPDTPESDSGDAASSGSGWAGRGSTGPGASVVVFRAADGATAECHVPFPPLPAASASGALASQGLGDDEPRATATRMAAHARADRTVGVLLVRLGGYAAGVFTGTDQHLAASKVGSRLVHGRSAAGGQSQRRFARRREKQASEALGAAADTAAAVFGPYNGRLDAVVLGGDKRAMSGLADDPRLRPFLDLAVDRFLTVPDPRLAVLKSTPRMFTAIRIRLTEPASPDDPAAAS